MRNIDLEAGALVLPADEDDLAGPDRDDRGTPRRGDVVCPVVAGVALAEVGRASSDGPGCLYGCRQEKRDGQGRRDGADGFAHRRFAGTPKRCPSSFLPGAPRSPKMARSNGMD